MNKYTNIYIYIYLIHVQNISVYLFLYLDSHLEYLRIYETIQQGSECITGFPFKLTSVAILGNIFNFTEKNTKTRCIDLMLPNIGYHLHVRTFVL